MRFTLAHELAHHVFGDHRQADTHAGLVSPGHWIEVRANAFAAELLMPLPAVSGYAATVASVTALAEAFGTSLIASAIRLETAGLATPEEAASLRIAIETAPPPAPYEDGIAAAKHALPRWPNPNSPLARGLATV
jgi:Zn-dependent peptidase ImmA (M78 family)